MSRAGMILDSKAKREKAARWVMGVPAGTYLELRAPKRTLDQNAKMWAMLTEISQQTNWYGSHLSPEDWKLLFLQALTSELRLVPNLAGDGFVPLGRSSSRLSKGEMSDMIELMHKFAAERGLKIGEEQPA